MNTYKNYTTAILTEKQKEDEDYLMSCIDRAISELVYDKEELKKAYNYYEGKRDKDQYRHLEDNYGVGTPTSVEFIPLIRRHVDVLVGEQLQNKLKPKITCNDTKTINSINKRKKEKIYEEELQRIQSQMQSNIWYALQSDEEKQAKQPPVDKVTEEAIAALKRDMEKSFVSDYEIAAQNVITHLIQSKRANLNYKMALLFQDLLIAGQCYYKVKLTHEGQVPEIEVLSPFDVFFEKNQNSPYINHSTRVVVRKWMNRQQIITEYGHLMDADAIEQLEDEAAYDETHNIYYIRSSSGGIISNIDVTIPGSSLGDYDSDFTDQTLIPVYEVEWLTNTKIDMEDGVIGKGYRVDPYEGVRIGGNIYLNMGKSEHTIRSVERPYEATVSTNGISYSSGRGAAYSLVLATANIQDKYDMLHFYRDTLIANSGVQGDFIDVSQLPTFLGTEPAERLMKWIGYKKGGVALVDTSQEGRSANHNTIYGGFDDTVKGDAIQAIQLVIQATEETCSAITGVWRERIGGIEQRDAVSNVETGIKQSAIITKKYFLLMDRITNELLTDSLNMCKISYRKGIMGTIILGDKSSKIFTVDPKNFSFTDYNIHIADSGDIVRDMQKIEAILMELIKSGQTDVEIIFDAITTESITEMQTSIKDSIKKKREENNVAEKLQQQLEEAQNQMKQIQAEMQKTTNELQALQKRNIDLEEKKLQIDYTLRKQANDNTRTFNDSKLEMDERKLELEKLQMFDNNPYNNEVKTV